MRQSTIRLDCPFCKKDVEIITLKRDPDNKAVVNVVYFHTDGDKHFTIYQPVTSVNGPRS